MTLTTLDQAVLAVEHDRARFGQGTFYHDVFDYINEGVSRRAYRSLLDGQVYKVGQAEVNVDEYKANNWFRLNLLHVAPEIAHRVVFPRIDCFRFINGYSVNVMPFVEHNPVYVERTCRELRADGQYVWCQYHGNGDCDCVRQISPEWWSAVRNFFSKMGCMDFDIGRNAFVPDGEHIVPIDLGYWGLSEGWGGPRSEPWL